MHDQSVRVLDSLFPVSGLVAIALLLCGSACRSQQIVASTPSAAERARLAAEAVTATFDKGTGLFHGTGWWNSANGITALADVSRAVPSQQIDTILTDSYKTAPNKFSGFINEFYDDEGWWALAWLDVYRLKRDPRYLKTAEAIFTDMSGGWSDTCGGGIWWKKNEHYKNAIANELFLSVAVQLARVSDGSAKARYLDWATKEERWFLASGMINGEGLVNDGLDKECHNNHRDTWSYNQGVLLTGLAGMYQLTRDMAALQTANRVATAATKKLTDQNGVLHDPCEPNCGEDGVQFKGIFVRNLVFLNQISPSEVYGNLIRSNAESVWTHARTEKNQFSVNWAGPAQDSGTGALISALDALTAEATLEKAGVGSSASKP